MRLTLRTLLAWIDDALPPEEARQIGKQVDESPYANQLVERIRRVTRRRRLTIPPSSGPDAVDPNLVAGYLDNEIDSDRVAELENRCLESDVHLAEVASCHEILSLIKNKAKVLPETRIRMYGLVKGQEARQIASEAALPTDGELSGAVPPWYFEETAGQSILTTIGPVILAALLIILAFGIGWANFQSAARSLGVSDDSELTQRAVLDREVPIVEDLGDQQDEQAPALSPENEDPSVESPTESPEVSVVATPPSSSGDDLTTDRLESTANSGMVGETSVDRPTVPERPAVELRRSEIPEGSLGLVNRLTGFLLITRDEGNRWTPLKAGDTLGSGDRVVNLAPFRATLQLGDALLTLISQVELRVKEPEGDQTCQIELIEGTIVLEPTDLAASDSTAAVMIGDRVIALQPVDDQRVGLSRFGNRPPGDASGVPLLSITTSTGELQVTIDDETADPLLGPIVALYDQEAALIALDQGMVPPWLDQTEASPDELQAGDRFATLLEAYPGNLTFGLLEGLRDERVEVQSLSVAALGAIGEFEQVLPLLSSENTPALRAAAIGVISRELATSEVDAAAIVAMIEELFSGEPETAADLIRLLVGYEIEQLERSTADQRQTLFAKLVEDLGSENPSVRQLAIQTIMGLTGRGSLGYDPDDPEGSGGLEAWQQLLNQGDLNFPGQPRP